MLLHLVLYLDMIQVLRFLEFSATTYELYNNIYFFYRLEIQNLIELLHSRISKETPSDIIVDEMYGAKISPPPNSPSCVIYREASSASCSLRKRKDGDENDNFLLGWRPFVQVVQVVAWSLWSFHLIFMGLKFPLDLYEVSTWSLLKHAIFKLATCL